MEFTGERLVPSAGGMDGLFLEHITRYMFAAEVLRGLRVLDAGCGCGYGSYHLARTGADSVVGIDISKEAITYCRKYYELGNLRYEKRSAVDTGLAPASFDAVTALEVFEHVVEPAGFLAEMRRVLVPGGVLVVSTPNAKTYDEARQGKKNPFHIREYSPQEFSDCLEDQFSQIFWYAQSPSEGLSIVPVEREAGTRIEAHARLVSPPRESSWGRPVPASASLDGCAYMVAVCFTGSDPGRVLPRAQWYSMIGDLGSGSGGERERRDATIRQLQGELETRTQWVEELKQELESRDATIRKLQREFEQRSRWALDLDKKVAQQARLIQALERASSGEPRTPGSPAVFDQ